MSNSMELVTKVSIELLVAVICGLIGWTARKAKDRLQCRQFRRVFGRNVISHDNIRVVFPRWTLLANEQRRARFAKVTPTDETMEFYGPDNVVAYHDLQAALDFANIFDGTFHKPVEFVSDLELGMHQSNTLILIGSPIVNQFVKNFIDQCNAPFEFRNRDETPGSQSACYIRDKNAKAKPAFMCGPDKPEYSVLMRLKKLTGAGNIIICAGINETGTSAAARFLRQNWKEWDDGSAASAWLLEQPRSARAEAKAIRRYWSDDGSDWKRMELRGARPNELSKAEAGKEQQGEDDPPATPLHAA